MTVVRVLAVAVVGAISVGYVQPLRSYLQTKEQVATREAEKRVLTRRQAALQRSLEQAGTDAFIEREARLLGFVKPGEQLYIVRGIEQWKRTRGS